MKQHIKKEQWDELLEIKATETTPDGQEQFMDFFQCSFNEDNLPTIGQLIEFLWDDLMLMELQPEGHWRIDYKTKKREIMQTKLELVDALWEAVKEKLNN